jgi:hypothetical protein
MWFGITRNLSWELGHDDFVPTRSRAVPAPVTRSLFVEVFGKGNGPLRL